MCIGRECDDQQRKLYSPNTTCFPSSQGVATVVMKNCEPFVFGPALAMERRNGLVCFRRKFSSGKDEHNVGA